MNKKPGLLFSVCLLAMIVLATSFDMNFGGNPALRLPAGVNPDSVLYVCPAGNSVWNDVAASLHMFGKYIYLLFAFAAIVILFSWGWALYQNLLKDKFNENAYKNPWDLTKAIFWIAVVCIVLFMTPNHFRSVAVRGNNSDWVLCENTSTGARAVKYSGVEFR